MSFNDDFKRNFLVALLHAKLNLRRQKGSFIVGARSCWLESQHSNYLLLFDPGYKQINGVYGSNPGLNS